MLVYNTDNLLFLCSNHSQKTYARSPYITRARTHQQPNTSSQQPQPQPDAFQLELSGFFGLPRDYVPYSGILYFEQFTVVFGYLFSFSFKHI